MRPSYLPAFRVWLLRNVTAAGRPRLRCVMRCRTVADAIATAKTYRFLGPAFIDRAEAPAHR